MRNKVISINRQFGSGGGEIAKALGLRLGIKVYDEELLDLIAQDCGYELNYVKDVVEHMTSSMNFDLSSFVGYSMGGIIGAGNLSGDDIFASQARVISKLAEEDDCIIVGRCADYILKDKENVLNVFAYGNKNFRVKKVAEKYGLSLEDARDKVKNTDKFRSKYYSYYCERKWGDPSNYHILIDTEKLDLGLSVIMLETLYKEI